MVTQKEVRIMNNILKNLYSCLSFPKKKQIKIDKTIEILKKAAPRNCSLEDILEFSISESGSKNDKIRFGWFKIYNPNILSEVINYNCPEIKNIQEIISILKCQTPEYAFGMEWNSSKEIPRLKAYFLRLPDIETYDILLNTNVPKIANNLNIPLPKQSYKNVYILGIDFNSILGIKIYERHRHTDLTQIENILKDKGVNDTYMLNDILNPKNHFYDTSVCSKYSKDGLDGVSVFFGIDSQSQTNDFIENNPSFKHFKDFLNIFQVKSKKPYCTHIGLVYNFKESNPKLSLYFQPRFKQ